MPLALVALATLTVWCCSKVMTLLPRTSATGKYIIAALATALVLLPFGALTSPSAIVKEVASWSGGAALLVMFALLWHRYPLSRAVALAALVSTLIFDWGYYHVISNGTHLAVRNFYNALRVQDTSSGGRHIRTLINGVINHGTQFMEPSLSEMPTTYYGGTSGIGRTINIKRNSNGLLRIGSIGLGAGTLTAYGRPGDLFRVYELNRKRLVPAVLTI